MNKRQRKKWLKQHNQYVPYSELWNLDITICNWIIPRLKAFKKNKMGYPGIKPMDTPEKWDEALDKMIHAFELAKYDPIDLDEDLNYVEYDFYDMSAYGVEKYKTIANKWKSEVSEGLHLFAIWFNDLWI